MKDFTLKAYKQLLLSIKQSGYSFITFEDWCDGNFKGRNVILRHDVDLKAENSLAIARIEAEIGIPATYYFRVVPQSNQPEIILSIAELGHEIGYHYEDLSLFHGDAEKAMKHFSLQLEYFRQFYPVRTICMHGSPTSKWDNRDLWKTYNYRDLGIIGEPYLDFISAKPEVNADRIYFTDTARMWDGEQYNIRDKSPGSMLSEKKPTGKENVKIHTTFEFINWFKASPVAQVIMITTHPQRWTDKTVDWYIEIIKQTIKNSIKRIIVRNRREVKL